LYVSLHIDPKQGYPFFLGYADETGTGAGEGFNCNFPLPRGTRWKDYRDSLDHALKKIKRFSPDAMVISLGVDTYEKDPISKFELGSDHFLKLGSMIAKEIRSPSLFIMEGGYDVENIGINVVNVLTGFSEA